MQKIIIKIIIKKGEQTDALFNGEHNETYKKAHAERNILKVLEGDCETAIGAHSKIIGEKIIIEAELFSLDGTQRFYEKKTGKINEFRKLGNELGQILKNKSKNSYKR